MYQCVNVNVNVGVRVTVSARVSATVSARVSVSVNVCRGPLKCARFRADSHRSGDVDVARAGSRRQSEGGSFACEAPRTGWNGTKGQKTSSDPADLAKSAKF